MFAEFACMYGSSGETMSRASRCASWLRSWRQAQRLWAHEWGDLLLLEFVDEVRPRAWITGHCFSSSCETFMPTLRWHTETYFCKTTPSLLRTFLSISIASLCLFIHSTVSLPSLILFFIWVSFLFSVFLPSIDR
jgi:hypothetical protein